MNTSIDPALQQDDGYAPIPVIPLKKGICGNQSKLGINHDFGQILLYSRMTDRGKSTNFRHPLEKGELH